MTDEQRAAIAAYVAAYIAYERSQFGTHTESERLDLDTDLDITYDRALVFGVTEEALRESVARALPETTAKPLRASPEE